MAIDQAELTGSGTEVARLYSEYGAQIERFCLGHLRSREDAEDAAQNTFLRAYTALRRGTVPEVEAAWLFKIARNVCLSRQLAGSRRSRVETPHDLQAMQDWIAAPEGERDELIRLDEALAALPERLRRAILLREWQGLSYSEIADELGVSQAAVETLIFRARRQLALALENAVVKPARRAKQALNLGSLLGGLKTLLGGLGAAKLAAGAAAVALLGMAGVEAGGVGPIPLGSDGHRVPLRTTPLQRVNESLVKPVAKASTAAPRRAKASARLGSGSKWKHRSASVSAQPGAPAAARGAAPASASTAAAPTVPAAVSPTTVPSGQATGTAEGPTAGTRGSASAPGSGGAPKPRLRVPQPATLPVSRPVVPPATGPAPSLPVTLPAPPVSTPTPSVSVPSVPLPTLPAVSTPAPAVPAPSLPAMPTVSTPAVTVPAPPALPTVPAPSVPDASLPKLP